MPRCFKYLALSFRTIPRVGLESQFWDHSHRGVTKMDVASVVKQLASVYIKANGNMTAVPSSTPSSHIPTLQPTTPPSSIPTQSPKWPAKSPPERGRLLSITFRGSVMSERTPDTSFGLFVLPCSAANTAHRLLHRHPIPTTDSGYIGSDGQCASNTSTVLPGDSRPDRLTDSPYT